MRSLSIILLGIFLLVSIPNVGITSDDIKNKKKSGKIKVKDKNKKKDKNNNKIKANSNKVDDSSSITIGSTGNVTNSNNKLKKGKVVINDTVLHDSLIKNGKIGNIKVKNNRAWIDGREIDLKTGKFKEPVKLNEEDITKLRNFFGENWEKYIKPKIKIKTWRNGLRSVVKHIV